MGTFNLNKKKPQNTLNMIEVSGGRQRACVPVGLEA